MRMRRTDIENCKLDYRAHATANSCRKRPTIFDKLIEVHDSNAWSASVDASDAAASVDATANVDTSV